MSTEDQPQGRELLWRMQGQLLIITVGLAFLFALIISGAGMAYLSYKIESSHLRLESKIDYYEDQNVIRHRELEGACHERQ